MYSKLKNAALVAILAGSPAAYAQVISVNGDFSGGFTSWDLSNAAYFALAPAGVVRIAGIPLAPVTLSQTMTVPTASFYRASFDLLEVVEANPTNVNPFTPGYSFSASLNGVNFFTLNNSIDPAPVSGLARVFSPWIPIAAGPTILEFATVGGNGQTIIRLDNALVENVPGPLPILGGLAAFGWSRKLRKKIKEADNANGGTLVAA